MSPGKFISFPGINNPRNNNSTFTCNEVIFWPFSVGSLLYYVGEAVVLQVNLIILSRSQNATITTKWETNSKTITHASAATYTGI